jgi:hypothetical protein
VFPPVRSRAQLSGRRLLCVYQHAPTPDAPGIYRHRRYFSELARRGWTIDLVSTPRNYMTGQVPARYRRRALMHEVIDGIDHHWVWSPGGIHRSRGRRVANYLGFAAVAGLRAISLPRPDVVFISSPPLTVAPLGPLLAMRFRCPWVLEIRDIWPESAVSVGWLRPESLTYAALERLAHQVTKNASTVLVPTPGLEPLVRAHGARTVVTLTGTVVPRPVDGARKAAVRARLDVGDEDCLFLYLGAIGVANGVDLLLEAVRLLPSAVHARVVMAGDGSARRSVEHAVGLESLDRLTLLPPVAKDEVEDLLAAADVGLHLLRPDPVFESALPSKVLEYLGARLPFITTIGGLPAHVAIESGGSAVTSSAELAREMECWSALTPQERRRRGEQAFEYGLREFGLDAGVARLEALLADVLARPRGS